jgi:hypothetical protein
MTWKAEAIPLRDIGEGGFYYGGTLYTSTGKRLHGSPNILVEYPAGTLDPWDGAAMVFRKRDYELQQWCEEHNVDVGSKMEGVRTGCVYEVVDLSRGNIRCLCEDGRITHCEPEYLKPIKAIKPYTPDEMQSLVGKVLVNKAKGASIMVIAYHDIMCHMATMGWYGPDRLLEHFTHLDGSPCGTLS